MPLFIAGVGTIDDNADLEALFREDAQGRYGLFAGQLLNEVQAVPALRNQIPRVIQKGLRSADRNERVSALAGASHYRGRLDLLDELEDIATRFPDEADTLEFVTVLARQPASERASGLMQRMLERSLTPSVLAALLRSVAWSMPGVVIERFQAAFAQHEDDAAKIMLGALASSKEFPRLRAEFKSRSQVDRDHFVALSYEAMGAHHSAAAYDEWLQLAAELNVSPPALPRPGETDAMKQFEAKLPSLIAHDLANAAGTSSRPRCVVLAPEVWVDMVRSPEGPPAVLAALLREHAIDVFASEAMLTTIEGYLRGLGWDSARVNETLSRIRDVATVCRESSAVELAKAAGLNVVYGIGPTVGTSVDGVEIRPVHELLSASTT
jgi:hypothetical protein